MAEPVEWSGEGWRAREVDMPHGDYRLSWAAQGSGGYFSVRLEGGQSSLLVSDDPGRGGFRGGARPSFLAVVTS
jgi:hypothetical protein